MQTETSIDIQADPMTVYQFGAQTERWPEILPHYRWVYVLDEAGDSRLVEMAARRSFYLFDWPVRWWAKQTNFPDEPRIAFTHVGGITKGMEVEWLFTPIEDGVRVTITHDLDLQWPVIGGIAADYVIGPVFIEGVAGRTLEHVKELAEARTPAMAGARS